jgi:nitronate monooxygenase
MILRAAMSQDRLREENGAIRRLNLPKIIQGGMGAGVSHWHLARQVALAGQLGVVSGTALDVILVRRLQDGDLGGHVRRALAKFPVQEIAQRIISQFYIAGGRKPGQPYKRIAAISARLSQHAQQLIMAANFVEVTLAKEGHNRPVGVNYLEKIQMATLSSLYGAMLAGVDFVLMGAGIPMEIPGALDRLAKHAKAWLRLNVDGARPEDDYRLEFDPEKVLPIHLPPLARPRFFAIISSVVLALALLKKASGRVDGFVVEGPSAGGHNAPPRGAQTLNHRGEPLYGSKDAVDLAKIKELGRPFYLAGGFAHPDKLQEALASGASGVQVGTAFAMSVDSGLERSLRDRILDDLEAGRGDVFTDRLASPTGFPFKVLGLEGSNSQQEVYEKRGRICDLGYLRTAYRRDDNTLGYRCAAEPVEDYVAKGGNLADTVGRKCLCNALLSNIGMPQQQADGTIERPLVTAGDDLDVVRILIGKYGRDYTAAQVIEHLTAQPVPACSGAEAFSARQEVPLELTSN